MGKNEISCRKRKSDETKEKIYTSAKELFKKHDIENVSVDSIVKKAGVSKGAFYIYFNSKDELISTFIEECVEKLDLDYSSYLQSLPYDMSSSQKLIKFVEKIADIICHSMGYEMMKLLYQIHLSNHVKTDALISYNRIIYSTLNSIILQGIEQGEFKLEMTAEEFSKHSVIILRGITYEWCIRYPDFDLKANYARHFKLLLTGITNRPS